jgi:hypothetical protein
MSLKIANAGSFFILDILHGAKLLELVLTNKDGNPIQVVKGIQTETNVFCSDGSYLMYPWVNRLHSQQFNIQDTLVSIDPVFRFTITSYYIV